VGFYIPEDGILHNHENLETYISLTGWTLYRKRNVSPVRCELGFYIPEEGIRHRNLCENLKSYIFGHETHISQIFKHIGS
jgi:hypothetical protein